MRWYLYLTFRHGVNGHKLDPPTHYDQIAIKRDETYLTTVP